MKNLLIFGSVVLLFAFYGCENSVHIESVEQGSTKLKNANVVLPTLNSNGILVFSDESHLEAVMKYLSEQQASLLNDYGIEHDEDCMKEDKALDLFEDNMGYTSLRKHYLAIECSELEAGVQVENLTMCPVADDVLATLLNEYGEIIIGKEVHILKSVSFRLSTDVQNMNDVMSLRNGNANYEKFNLFGLKNPEGGPESGECIVDYDISINRAARTATINWTGSVSANHKVRYDWGDGTPAEVVSTIPTASRTHTYVTSGNYTILISVFNDVPGEQCSETSTENINLDQICAVVFSSDAGADGLYTFTPYNFVFANNANVLRWEWNFGDGSPLVTVQGANGTVTHTYTCEGQYAVTLKVITSVPSCSPQMTNTITVTNVACFDYDYLADWSEESYGSGSAKKIKYKTWLSNWLFTSGIDNERVKAKMKNYKRKANGKWKKEKADLKIIFSGNVYVADGNNLWCDGTGRSLNGQLNKSRKSLKIVEDKNEQIAVKPTDAYTVEYWVGGQIIKTFTASDAGCN